MKTGTYYFPSYGAALRYYRPYIPTYPETFVGRGQAGTVRTQELRSLVDQKLNAGEIHIGKPPLKPGETLSIEDNRWHVTDNNS